MPGLGIQVWGLKPGFHRAQTLPSHPLPEQLIPHTKVGRLGVALYWCNTTSYIAIRKNANIRLIVLLLYIHGTPILIED